MKRVITLLLLVVMTIVICTGCITVVPLNKKANDPSWLQNQKDEGFDPHEYVKGAWSKVLDEVKAKSHAMPEVLDAYKKDLKACGEKYGMRASDDQALWYFIISDTAKVLEVDRSSKNGLMAMDTAPYDGEADYYIQVGPVYKGSAIRDTMSFIKFGDFRNQLSFGDLAKAFNKYVDTNVIAPMNVDSLAGQEIVITGAFPQGDKIVVITTEMKKKD